MSNNKAKNLLASLKEELEDEPFMRVWILTVDDDYGLTTQVFASAEEAVITALDLQELSGHIDDNPYLQQLQQNVFDKIGGKRDVLLTAYYEFYHAVLAKLGSSTMMASYKIDYFDLDLFTGESLL